ncbi:14280_t:CDS:2, partial [Funneliformis geosporum]
SERSDDDEKKEMEVQARHRLFRMNSRVVGWSLRILCVHSVKLHIGLLGHEVERDHCSGKFFRTETAKSIGIGTGNHKVVLGFSVLKIIIMVK